MSELEQVEAERDNALADNRKLEAAVSVLREQYADAHDIIKQLQTERQSVIEMCCKKLEGERDQLAAENRELTYANEQLRKHLEDRAKGLDPFTKMLRDELDTEYNKRKQAEAEVARLADWQHTSFCSAEPDGTLLCPVCDQSEVVGHAPDCCAALWAKAYHENQVAALEREEAK